MIKKLQHIFALSEKGAKDLAKAVSWCFVCNLALMFPVGAVLFTVQHLLGCLESVGNPMDGFWIYVGFALAVLLLLFILHWFQYASLYIATYRESANRRVSLAETLRRLPLSFFGNRDLSDLTSTMIADCSSLDQMFSHYVPQLFASIGSTLVIGVCMFACDWRMALAVLWVVPVAVALTAGSKKIQDAFGTKNILNKRAVADCIQEGLETIRDIKACHRQERYLGDLEAKLSAMEGSSIRSELATGVFVCSAQAFLRLGLATTVLTGGALLLAGELSFLYFLGFLFAAARLYDPLGVVLQNIAATFNTKLQIERMRSILEQPVQTGTEDFRPSSYDITFDHVSFAYREGAGVLEDVSFTARQGEVTALIGPSGGGKSTACKLAARFWDVSGGKVLLGGTDVSTVDPETLLRSYSMVFQDVVLFRDTVMENIRLGRRGATDEEVLEAAKAALGWSHPPFTVPDDIREAWDAKAKGRNAQAAWEDMFARYQAAYPELYAQWQAYHSKELPEALLQDDSLFAADKPTAPVPELYAGRPDVNQRFEVSNMLPGDTETRYFCVRAYHEEDITLFFRAEVTEQTKNLGDVLHIKVTHLDTGKVLCDAAFNEIDGEEFSELLKADAREETTAYYQIDVSLDTSVGNEYQAALLKADFEWCVKDEGGLVEPPQTGDTTNFVLWTVLAVSSLLLMIFLWKRRKEEEKHA